MVRSQSIRYLLVRACVSPAAIAAAATVAMLTGPAAGQALAQRAGQQTGTFVLTSADGESRVQLGLTAQTDGRFALNDDADVLTDSFYLRRLRPSLRGRVAGVFDFVVSADFGRGGSTLQDAYVETAISSTAALRIGRSKLPFGYERLLSVQHTPFMERGLPSAIAPNRDIGLQVLGEALEGQLGYSVGVFNGAPDGSSLDTDSGDGKDFVGRLVGRPSTGLTVALAVSAGDHTGSESLPAYRTTVFQSPFFAYAGDARIDGRVVRYSPSAAFYSGAFGGFVEYVTSRMTVARDDARESTWHEAWQVTGSWVLTGEDASENGVVPAADFGAGGWGALQVSARVHRLQIDEDAFVFDFAAPGSNRRATAWSAGVSWILNRHITGRAMLERTTFDQSTTIRPSETTAALRAQLVF